MHLVIRKYKNIKGDKQEMMNKINNGFLPLITKIEGFVDYYCIFSDESTLVSVSIFQSTRGTNESILTAASWVAKNLSMHLPDKPEIVDGDVFAKGRRIESEKRKSA